MSRFTRSLSFVLAVAIATGSMSYELCGAADDEGRDPHSLRHSHGGYEHLHHHHHHVAAGAEDHANDDDCFDHLPIDLKAVRHPTRSRQVDTSPVLPPALCPAPVGTVCRVAAYRGLPPRTGPPDPTRQIRQIRSTVLLV